MGKEGKSSCENINKIFLDLQIEEWVPKIHDYVMAKIMNKEVSTNVFLIDGIFDYFSQKWEVVEH
jgi:hypothetical protein